MAQLENNNFTDIFADIDSYRENLLISNVIDFFAKNDIVFTKNVIGNYLKLNILPPLHNKKYYQRKHLYFLYFIHIYKKLYTLEEIGLFLKKVDDSIGIENFYIDFNKKQRETYDSFNDILDDYEMEEFEELMFIAQATHFMDKLNP